MMKRLAPLLFALGWSLASAASHSSQAPTLKQTKELMASVCRSGAATGACTPCPSFVGDGSLEGTLTPQAVTYGKFLNGRDIYALLDLSGCESHASNFGGSVLLRWRGLTRWDFVKYLPGLRSGDCQKYPAAGGRETLLCEGGYAGMGIVDTSLFQLDLARALAGTDTTSGDDAPLFLEDNTLACLDAATATAQRLVSWGPVNLNGDGLPDLRVRVRSGFGKTGLTPEQCGNVTADVPTRAYTLDYLYNGKKFIPTAATRGVLKRLLADRTRKEQ